MGERSSMEVDSVKNIVPARALIKSLKKRKKLIIRPLKPLNKDGARMLSMKGVNNKIIIFKTYYKAVNDPVYGWWWLKIIETKLLVLALYNVWELIDLPNNKKSISCKWVFTVKVDLKDRITKFKARLIVKKYKQIYNVNYTEIFIFIVRFESLRILLVIIAYLDLEYHQINVVLAYLAGELHKENKEIYMDLSKRMLIREENEGKVYRILKSLYGFK